MTTHNILVEASGSLVAPYLIKAIKAAGHNCVASDIETHSAGWFLADDFLLLPKAGTNNLWNEMQDGMDRLNVDIVIPSFDSTMFLWASHKHELQDRGIKVLISDPETIEVFQDKWVTYNFFLEHDLPCAKTSVSPEFPLLKPRRGSGAKDIKIIQDALDRAQEFEEGCISQEILQGQEYTVDCLFDAQGKPVYILPRLRLGVQNGKSTGGMVVKHAGIDALVRRLSSNIPLVGPVNIQLFEDGNKLSLVEVNPRIAGGMALGFKATENWVPLFLDILNDQRVTPGPVDWGLRMVRGYEEFYFKNEK